MTSDYMAFILLSFFLAIKLLIYKKIYYLYLQKLTQFYINYEKR